MIELSHHVAILDSEIEMMAIRAQGPGRQHVNKTSMAVHLRFDIRAPNLPEFYKQRLLNASHHLITREGIVVIKVQSSRRLALNREAAIERLVSLIRELTVQQKSRKPTKLGRAAKLRRRNEKSQKSTIKALRSRVQFD